MVPLAIFLSRPVEMKLCPEVTNAFPKRQSLSSYYSSPHADRYLVVHNSNTKQ